MSGMNCKYRHEKKRSGCKYPAIMEKKTIGFHAFSGCDSTSAFLGKADTGNGWKLKDGFVLIRCASTTRALQSLTTVQHRKLKLQIEVKRWSKVVLPTNRTLELETNSSWVQLQGSFYSDGDIKN
ncbi:Hypothetical predicted protein, partial [Paramuricea clavata]